LWLLALKLTPSADFTEGGGGFVDCEGYVGVRKEADGEGEATAADGDVDWFLRRRHDREVLRREVRKEGKLGT
jgi:hypothetical protein